MIRIGFGTDVHQLVEGRRLIVGGVEIPATLGADGHSDADVLLHAVTDAVLGAMALGDIGTHFPNTDSQWKNASSSQFLRHAVSLVFELGYRIGNIDTTIDLETPKLRPHIERIRSSLASVLDVDTGRVSVKAKTGESVDAVGRGAAIRAQAIVLLIRD